jgi:hypothetical protein
VNLEHLRVLAKRLRNPVFGTGLIAAHGDKGQQSEPDDFGIDLCDITAERTARFELANSLQNGRRGEPDRPGYFGLRFPSVGLQQLEYVKVGIV